MIHCVFRQQAGQWQLCQAARTVRLASTLEPAAAVNLERRGRRTLKSGCRKPAEHDNLTHDGVGSRSVGDDPG